MFVAISFELKYSFMLESSNVSVKSRCKRVSQRNINTTSKNVVDDKNQVNLETNNYIIYT